MSLQWCPLLGEKSGAFVLTNALLGHNQMSTFLASEHLGHTKTDTFTQDAGYTYLWNRSFRAQVWPWGRLCKDDLFKNLSVFKKKTKKLSSYFDIHLHRFESFVEEVNLTNLVLQTGKEGCSSPNFTE